MAILGKDEHSCQQQGIFHAAWNLLDQGELSDAEAEDLRSLLQWFNDHMPCPRGTTLCGGNSRNNSRSHRAIFWFTPGAHEYRTKAWEIVHLLRLQGLLVEILKTRTPGLVVYRDAIQVAAIPNRSTFSPGRQDGRL